MVEIVALLLLTGVISTSTSCGVGWGVDPRGQGWWSCERRRRDMRRVVMVVPVASVSPVRMHVTAVPAPTAAATSTLLLLLINSGGTAA